MTMKMTRRNFLRTAAIGSIGLSVLGMSSVAAAEQTTEKAANVTTAYSRLGYALNSPIEVEPGVVSVSALMDEQVVTINTCKLDDDTVKMLVGSPETTPMASWAIKPGSLVEICFNSDDEIINVNRLFDLKEGAFFNTMKYGAEFSPVGGEAGNMIASGWVLEKMDGKIAMGDTNHFYEEYTLSSDVRVFEINTQALRITRKTIDDLPATGKTDGEYYKTANRQMAVVVFDGNYKTADTAKVTDIYYLTPQCVIPEKYLVPLDTMALYSCFPDNPDTDGVIEKPTKYPWLAYTKPFEIVPGKFYFAGDNDVACYLFNTKEGLVLLDTGWPLCAYVYMQQIETLGFDPRQIKYILLTHGHGDHYGTAYQFAKMIKNAGGDPVVYETYEDTYGYDKMGFPEVKGILSDWEVISIIDKTYPWDEWLDFGDVRVMAMLTAGHTIGTASFIFEVTPDGGKPMTFGYMGGYGTVNAVNKGAQRVAFVHGLRYLQQNVICDYSLPQHMAHHPLLEINKAAEIAGIPLLEALVPGWEEWYNFLERRMVMQVSEQYMQKWRDNPFTEDGRPIALSTQSCHTIEAYGPYKREAGEYKITLRDAGFVMHEFNMNQNPNPKLDGIVNCFGMNLGEGFQITRDGYMHDPDKWFIQISVNVDDDYQGEFRNLESGNGPVENVRPNWSEILRTEYFASKEEAEAVLAKLEVGKTYTVNMTKLSDIVVNTANPLETFIS